MLEKDFYSAFANPGKCYPKRIFLSARAALPLLSHRRIQKKVIFLGNIGQQAHDGAFPAIVFSYFEPDVLTYNPFEIASAVQSAIKSRRGDFDSRWYRNVFIVFQCPRESTIDSRAVFNRHSVRPVDEHFDDITPRLEHLDEFEIILQFEHLLNVPLNERCLFRFLHRATLNLFAVIPIGDTLYPQPIATPEIGCTFRISLSLALHEDRKTYNTRLQRSPTRRPCSSPQVERVPVGSATRVRFIRRGVVD